MPAAALPRRRHRSSTLGRADALVKPALQLAALTVGVIVWQLVGTAQPHLVAPFSTVALTAGQMARSGSIWSPIGQTLGELLLGYLLALMVGIPLGIAMALNRDVEKAADMYLGWLLAIPELAMIPFFIIALGVGLAAQLAVVVAFALPVIVQNTLAGMMSAQPSVLEMARSFELDRSQVVTKVLVPGALPMIMVGARMGLGRSLLGVIGAGFFIQLFGLGGMIYYYETTFDLGAMFLSILLVVMVAFASSIAVQEIDRRLTFWKGDTGAS